jgi:hypothetical protein
VGSELKEISRLSTREEMLASTGSMAFGFLVDNRQIKFIENIICHSTNETLVIFANIIFSVKMENFGKKYAVIVKTAVLKLTTEYRVQTFSKVIL